MFEPVARDLQSRFPALLDVKAAAQRHWRTVRRQPFESEYGVLAALKDDGGDYVDVGANRGQSIDAIRLYHPGAAIHAFEPNTALAARLSDRYEGDKRICIHPMGLGDRPRSVSLHVPTYRNFAYDGLASFEKSRAHGWLNADTVWRFDPNHLGLDVLPCEIETLDTQGLQPTFLKLHVQGFELDCLKGGETAVYTFKPLLLIANHHGADLWLRDRGWLQCAFREGRLFAMSRNDPDLYNCLYLHPGNPDHVDIMNRLSAGL